MEGDLQARLAEMMAQHGVAGDAATRLRETLLARLAETSSQDPVRMLLRRMLEARITGASPAGEGPADVDTAAGMRRLLRAAARELKTLQERSGQLALALGACPDCWGQHTDCRRCAGAGGPGWTAPDPGWFERYVAPVMRGR